MNSNDKNSTPDLSDRSDRKPSKKSQKKKKRQRSEKKQQKTGKDATDCLEKKTIRSADIAADCNASMTAPDRITNQSRSDHSKETAAAKVSLKYKSRSEPLREINKSILSVPVQNSCEATQAKPLTQSISSTTVSSVSTNISVKSNPYASQQLFPQTTKDPAFNESLRWEGVVSDPDEELDRLHNYKMNRRKRYLAASNQKHSEWQPSSSSSSNTNLNESPKYKSNNFSKYSVNLNRKVKADKGSIYQDLVAVPALQGRQRELAY